MTGVPEEEECSGGEGQAPALEAFSWRTTS